MAISLGSDRLLDVDDVQTIIPGLTNLTRISLLINSVSASFRRYTGRIGILSGTHTQYESLPPAPYQYLYLRATPVESITSVTLMYDGEADEVLASSDYALENASTGKLVLPNHSVSGHGIGYTLKIVFVGGWDDVPGDVQESALQAVVYKRDKLDGRAGVRTASIEGMSTSYENADLPQSVQDCWRKYRIY